MPRYNFLDEAGLKKYHQLAGYSEIPLEYTMYKKLDTSNGEVVDDPSSSKYCVTDYIKLPTAPPYCLKISGGSRTICFYDENNNFLSGKTLSSSEYKLILMNEVLKAVKFRVSFAYAAGLHQVSIRALHDNTTNWLYDKINTDITETNKLIIRLHADYGFGATPNPIEKDVPTPITIKSAYFQFDKEDVIPTGGVKVTASTKTPTGTVTKTYDISSIINNSGTVSTASISLPTTYTMTITHLGMDLKKSITVNAYYPMYFGSSGNESISKDNLNTIFSTATTIGAAKEVSGVGVFTKQPISGSPNGTRNFKVNSSQYIYLLVPSTMTINKVTSSGFDVPMSGTAPEVTGTNKGSYRVYRSEKKVNGGTLSIVIS